MKYLLAICAFALSASSAAQIPFSKITDYSLAGGWHQAATNCTSVLPNDSGFFMIGDQIHLPQTTRCTYISAFTYTGQQLWHKPLFFPGHYNGTDFGYTSLRISPTRAAIYGYEIDTASRGDSIRLAQPYLYFFNNQGDSLCFAKDYDSLLSRRPFGVVQLSNGQLLGYGWMGLSTWSYASDPQHLYPDSSCIYLARYDTLGNKLWEKHHRCAPVTSFKESLIKKALPTPDGGAVLAGVTSDATIGAPFLMRIDSLGNELWLKTYRYGGYPAPQQIDIAPAPGNGFYFVSCKATLPPGQSGGPGNSLFYYGRLNADGDTLWTRSFANTGLINGQRWSEGQRVVQKSNGDLVMLGQCYYDGYYHPTLLFTDSNGAIKSYREHFYRNYIGIRNSIHTIRTTSHGGLLMGGGVSHGYSNSPIWDTVGFFAWILHTDSLGCLDPSCAAGDTIWTVSVASPPLVKTAIQIYPNPASDHIVVNGLPGGEAELTLTDARGATIYRQVAYQRRDVLPVGHLPSGLYLLHVRVGGGPPQTFKLIKR